MAVGSCSSLQSLVITCGSMTLVLSVQFLTRTAPLGYLSRVIDEQV